MEAIHKKTKKNRSNRSSTSSRQEESAPRSPTPEEIEPKESDRLLSGDIQENPLCIDASFDSVSPECDDTELDDISEIPTRVMEIAVAPPMESTFHAEKEGPDLFGFDVVHKEERLAVEEDEDFNKMTEIIASSVKFEPLDETQLLSLYQNEELAVCPVFTDHFIDNELGGNHIQRHVLYELLTKYLRCREKVSSNAAELDALVNESNDIQQRLWVLETVKVTESGECQDGNPVEASHTYQIGNFNVPVLNKLSRILAKIQEKANEEHALYLYSCQVTKLQIEDYIRKLSQGFVHLPLNAPVALASEGNASRTSELCNAISVFFYFQRLPCKDTGFLADLRLWLTTLIAMLLRVSSWRDHVFLLNHVLRCPGGVCKWATSYVQAPVSPHTQGNTQFLNHLITMVSLVVSPIDRRDLFLNQLEKPTEEGEDLWVIVDSDGEDEEDTSFHLKENDVISLLNQIPLDSLFRMVFDVKRCEGSDTFTGLEGPQLLRAFAIVRLLIEIIGRGVQTYSSMRYQQFSKRLASIILHAAQYSSDAFQFYRKDNVDCNELNDRLQAEYDHIILTACGTFIRAPQKTVLQFLISLPYSLVSLPTLWQMYQIVLLPRSYSDSEETCTCSTEWWIGVEEHLSCLTDAEVCYVLTTVSNMALSRAPNDWSFIQLVSVHLLQIGVVNSVTKETCYKTSRSLLSNLTHKHPPLISVIMKKIGQSLSQAGNMSIYLFKELPLNLWVPTKEDLGLLEHWLLACQKSSTEQSLAIFILHNLNWGLNPESSTELFLPREVHCEVALLVVRLAILHAPESPTSGHSTVIADTIKHLTSSSSRLITEQTLGVWVWSMLFKLRLHLMDQPEPTICAILSNPIQFFSILPSLESLPNELSPLIRALKENQVTAIFTSLLMTSTGHSVPLICQTGFNLITILMQCHRYLAVLVLLEHIVPLFIECQESLLISDKFLTTVTGLMTADKTFLKFAMSLISSEFPGLILKQFGDLIQVHLENYRRYNLSSPGPIIELWMRVLAKVWLSEPISTSFLMDKVLRVAFFLPEIKSLASEILVELLEAHMNTTKVKFSLLNWVSGSSASGNSLINKSSSDTPWFSFFALELEQELLFTRSGLWKQLLVELSQQQGKANVDAALKKSCATLKIPGVPSSTLPIYRWSQLALDTPVDFPALPVFWQKFFTLFLARVPSVNWQDLGSVGGKFFEGTINRSFFMRLKKKLNDCKSFYESKHSHPTQIVTQEKKDWFESMALLYNTFLLWLEDSTMLEPGLNLHTISASHLPRKLTSVLNEENLLWFEYVDFDSVRLNQRQSLQSWEQSICRHIEIVVKPLMSPTEPDPVKNIVKRLQKYENPVPPPALKTLPVLVPEVPCEAYYNKYLMLDLLKDSFKALTSYAQVYQIRKGDHSSTDYCLLELVPMLYRSVETDLTLHAACDTHNPGSIHQNSVNSLNCAGPAVICIKISEIHVDTTVDMAIHSNRLEAQALIKRCLQPPSHAVCAGSIHIQQTVRSIENKCIELKRAGDVQLLNSLQEVGVNLFYHMTYIFTEEAASYPPMKQLITSCVETLGQCFISVDETQGPMLLSRVLENPSLTSLLAVHFTPTSSSPQLYVQLYKTLMSSISASNLDLIFVLLTKFDVGLWVETQKPCLSERSQLIELVADALASAGQDPSTEFTMIHEVLRRQLCVLTMVDLTNHIHHVLNVLLKHSESHSLATEVWYDVINALVWHTGVQFKPHTALAQVVANMASFAVNQTILSLHEVQDLVKVLSKYFMDERLQYGLYGLYPKYRVYISSFTTLFGTISHSLVSLTIAKNQISTKACDEIWDLLVGLYSPWICPYFAQNLTQPTAAWIQQLTDDRSILLPWIATDSGHAHKIAAIFTESIRFFMESLPGCNEAYSKVWQFYITNFAHTVVQEHVLSVINSNFLSLPWCRFSPTLPDLELMLKVSDTYVPCCHTFLGAVFIDIPWTTWIENMSSTAPQLSPKVHSSLLHLLVKLSNEPNVRQSGKIVELLRASKCFHWETVDCASYESVVNWFVMSYDPKLALNLDDKPNDIDISVMELLRYSAGFSHGLPGYHISTPRKRQMYIRASVKLIISCLSKHKSILNSKLNQIRGVIEDMLILINTVVPQTGGNYGEASLHLSELLCLVNLSNAVSKLAADTICDWVSKRGDCAASAGLLKSLGTTIEQGEPLGRITEEILTSVFNDRSGGDWDSILNYVTEPVPRKPPLEEIFVTEGRLLTLYAFVAKRLTKQFDLAQEMSCFSDLIHWLNLVKPSAELECKIIPLFHLCLIMASRLSDENPSVTEKNLRALVEISENWFEFKPSWGFLGAIGVKKHASLSIKSKGLNRILGALVLAQLPERKNELADQPPFIRTTSHSPGGLTSNNMELGPSKQALRSFSDLELSATDKTFAGIRSNLESSLASIRKTETSMNNAHQVYLKAAKLLYQDVRFIQAITLGL